MKKLLMALAVILPMLVTTACAPIERQAYNTAVAAKAFVAATRASHPECVPGSTATVCVDLVRATAAKDFLIDSAEIYCASPGFDTGAACTPPAKGTDAFTQAVAKLKAAIAGYNQAAKDLKGAM